MQREQRLRRSADFADVHRRGRGTANDVLAVRGLKTERAESRVGFAVGKRVGKAVVRNRVKRRLRAAITSLPLSAGWDIVVIARPLAATRDYQALRASLAGLLHRSRLLQPKERDADAPNPGTNDRNQR